MKYNNKTIDIRYSNYQYMKNGQPIRRRPETPENKTKRLLEEKYTQRGNQCPRCFTFKSTITGECYCDND